MKAKNPTIQILNHIYDYFLSIFLVINIVNMYNKYYAVA